MAAETDSLLSHGDLVGEDGGLGEDAGGVDLGVGQDLVHPRLQLGPIVRHGLGGALLYQSHLLLDGVRPGEDVGLHPLPLPGPHLVEVGQGPVQDRVNVGGHGLGILLRLLGQQDLRKAGQQRHRDVPRQLIAPGQLGQGGIVAVGHRLVHLHLDLFPAAVVHGDEHVHLSPGNGPLHPGLHPVLRKEVQPGDADAAV